MPDFQKALQSLKAADLAYIQQIIGASFGLDTPAETARKRRPKSPGTDLSMEGKPGRTRKGIRYTASPKPDADEHANAGVNPASDTTPTPPMPTPIEPTTSTGEVTAPDVTGHDMTGPDELGPDTDKASTATLSAAASLLTEKARTRRSVAHEWPPVGTVLTATYFGVVYRAEVIAATKRLKSGKQLRLLDGPAKGKRLDSFSKAMLVATAKQRREQKLGRKGTSNGWSFWVAESPSSASSASPQEPSRVE